MSLVQARPTTTSDGTLVRASTCRCRCSRRSSRRVTIGSTRILARCSSCRLPSASCSKLFGSRLSREVKGRAKRPPLFLRLRQSGRRPPQPDDRSIELPELNLGVVQIRPVEADEITAAKIIESVNVVRADVIGERNRQRAIVVHIAGEQAISAVNLPDSSLEKLNVVRGRRRSVAVDGLIDLNIVRVVTVAVRLDAGRHHVAILEGSRRVILVLVYHLSLTVVGHRHGLTV